MPKNLCLGSFQNYRDEVQVLLLSYLNLYASDTKRNTLSKFIKTFVKFFLEVLDSFGNKIVKKTYSVQTRERKGRHVLKYAIVKVANIWASVILIVTITIGKGCRRTSFQLSLGSLGAVFSLPL